MSELVREALRHYDRRAWWDEVNAYGRQRAEERGLREADVERLVHESRRGSGKPSRSKWLAAEAEFLICALYAALKRRSFTVFAGVCAGRWWPLPLHD